MAAQLLRVAQKLSSKKESAEFCGRGAQNSARTKSISAKEKL
jgi:hypothetical protein